MSIWFDNKSCDFDSLNTAYVNLKCFIFTLHFIFFVYDSISFYLKNEFKMYDILSGRMSGGTHDTIYHYSTPLHLLFPEYFGATADAAVLCSLLFRTVPSLLTVARFIPVFSAGFTDAALYFQSYFFSSDISLSIQVFSS